MEEEKVDKIVEKLREKAGEFIDKKRMPSINQIHELLEHFGIEHRFENHTNIVEHRSKGNVYANSRYEGKQGKKLEINLPEGSVWMDTSDSYYSWNTVSYAREIIKLLVALGKIKETESQTQLNKSVQPKAH